MTKPLEEDEPLTRAVGYTRVSSDTQARYGKSLEAQKKMVAQYCMFAGLELIGIVEEPGVSAGKKIKQRPGLVHVLDMVQDGEVGAVVVLKLDRMFRSVVDASEVLEFLQKHDASFHSVVERFDTSTAMGKGMLQMVTVFSEMERAMAGERTKTVLHSTKRVYREDLPPEATSPMRHRVLKNKLLVGRAPYGYEWVDARIRESRDIGDMDRVRELEDLKARHGELIPVPKEMAVVETIKDNWTQKMRGEKKKNCQTIANLLNVYGYLTRKGTPWKRAQVNRIVNRRY